MFCHRIVLLELSVMNSLSDVCACVCFRCFSRSQGTVHLKCTLCPSTALHECPDVLSASVPKQ